MKIEMIDVAVGFLAVVMLAFYLRLGNAGFLYAFLVLIVPEMYFLTRKFFRKKERAPEPVGHDHQNQH